MGYKLINYFCLHKYFRYNRKPTKRSPPPQSRPDFESSIDPSGKNQQKLKSENLENFKRPSRANTLIYLSAKIHKKRFYRAFRTIWFRAELILTLNWSIVRGFLQGDYLVNVRSKSECNFSSKVKKNEIYWSCKKELFWDLFQR